MTDILKNCNQIFIDFDGVIVDSNKFKEEAIAKAITKLLGHTKNNIENILLNTHFGN